LTFRDSENFRGHGARDAKKTPLFKIFVALLRCYIVTVSA
jgi:hypothetical protein